MTNQTFRSIRIYYLIGVAFAFISIFMDWYIFQGIDSSNTVLVDWSYSLLSDWYSPVRLDTELNDWYKPINASIPFPLSAFFIIMLIIASFGAVFYSSEEFSKMKHTKGFAIINLGVLLLFVFFIVVFPIMYLFPNNLLFPLLIFYDYELNLAFYFIMGLGYYLQVIAFACCFPYTSLYYKLAHTFEIEPKLDIANIFPINELDLDKLIAQMELINQQQQMIKNTKNSRHSKSPEVLEAQEIYNQFLASKKRRNPAP